MNDVFKVRSFSNAEKTVIFFVATLGSTLLGGLAALVAGAHKGYGMLSVGGFSPPVIPTSLVWGLLFYLSGLSLYAIMVRLPRSRADIAVRNWAIALWGVQLAFTLVLPFLVFGELLLLAFAVCTLLNGIIAALIVVGYKVNVVSALLMLPQLAFYMAVCYAIIYNVAY